jgi:hypothetical protein
MVGASHAQLAAIGPFLGIQIRVGVSEQGLAGENEGAAGGGENQGFDRWHGKLLVG